MGAYVPIFCLIYTIKKMHIVPQTLSEYNKIHDNICENTNVQPANKERLNAIAKRYGVSLDMVMSELDRGVKIELKYTDSKQIALRNAIDNIKSDILYYSNMEKFDNEIKQAKKRNI